MMDPILKRQGLFYDKKYRAWKSLPSVEMFWEHLGDQIIRSLNISAGKFYLFLGAGDGYLTEYIARKSGARIVGIDISPVSLEICTSKKSEKTSYLLADAQKLPFKENSFDGIIAPAVLHHLSRLDVAFREFKRVLVENGTIFSIDPKDYFLRRLFNPIIKRVISEDETQFKPHFIENVYKKAGFDIICNDPLYLLSPTFVPLLRRIGYDIPRWLFKSLLKIDILCAHQKFLSNLSWVVTIVGRSTKAGGNTAERECREYAQKKSIMSSISNRFLDIVNDIILPFKLIIPQPVIEKIPGLTTNKEIRVQKVLDYLSPDMNVLDVGCGDNVLMKRHKIAGGSGIGIDVYPWDGVDLLVEDSSKLPFEDKSFDSITFVACLNHIPNRSAILKEAHRLLKENGIIIITFLSPAVSTIWHKICFWDRDQSLRSMKEGEVYGFTQRQIQSLLQSVGFKIIKRVKFSWRLNNLYLCSKIQGQIENSI